jgi:hypothetical protein
MHIYLLILSGLLSLSSFGMVVKVADGVYAGTSKAVSGETVYLGMELIGPDNIQQWKNYAIMADHKPRAYDYLLTQSRPDLRPLYVGKLVEELGFGSDQEYQTYMDYLQGRNLCEEDNGSVYINDRLEQAFGAIPNGVIGFKIDDNGNYYVAYISKKPVTGKRVFTIKKPPLSATLKEYNDEFDDLLISVGSNLNPGELYYENRGIFRNPKSFVDGGYKDLAIMLHAFTAAVVKIIIPEKKYLKVRAAAHMAKILKEKLKPKDIHYVGAPDFQQDTPFLITIDGMSDRYNGL